MATLADTLDDHEADAFDFLGLHDAEEHYVEKIRQKQDCDLYKSVDYLISTEPGPSRATTGTTWALSSGIPRSHQVANQCLETNARLPVPNVGEIQHSTRFEL